MSKFAIYKSTKASFRSIRVINRSLFIAIIILWLLMTTVFTGEYEGSFMKVIDILIPILFFLVLGSVITFSLYTKRSVVVIGEITVSLTNIQKSVGGLSWVYDLADIEELNIRKQTMALLLAGNRDSSRTYLVTLKSKNGTKERFVISSQSIDKPEVNFIETLEKLEKLSNRSLSIIK